jgi:hypothetical protein
MAPSRATAACWCTCAAWSWPTRPRFRPRCRHQPGPAVRRRRQLPDHQRRRSGHRHQRQHRRVPCQYRRQRGHQRHGEPAPSLHRPHRVRALACLRLVRSDRGIEDRASSPRRVTAGRSGPLPAPPPLRHGRSQPVTLDNLARTAGQELSSTLPGARSRPTPGVWAYDRACHWQMAAEGARPSPAAPRPGALHAARDIHGLRRSFRARQLSGSCPGWPHLPLANPGNEMLCPTKPRWELADGS